MKQKLLLVYLLVCSSFSLFSQIIFDKKNEYFGQIENFDSKTFEFQCLNKYDYPVKVSIESISNNIEVKILEDSIEPKTIFKFEVNLFPTKVGGFREKINLKFSDNTKAELNINGYIASFGKNYSNSLDNHQLFGDKEIVFMVIDGLTQKPIPLAKIYISNLQNYKSYIGYADKFGILKNKIPEGKYLIQSLVKGYKAEIAGVKTYPDLNVAQVLLDRQDELVKLDSPQKKETAQIAKLEPKRIDSVSALVPIESVDTVVEAVNNSPEIAVEENLRRPLNIIMLIDNSTSMGESNRMNQVKECISHLVKNYNKSDQLAILTFNEEVNTILPSSKITSFNDVQSKIDDIVVSGKTNGEAGINQAFEMMEKVANPESLNMIVLATDGRLANSDYVERKILKKIEDMNLKGYLLSVMGFTSSTYNSKKMQQMSDIGGGLYLNMNDHKEDYNSLLLDEIYSTLLKIER